MEKTNKKLVREILGITEEEDKTNSGRKGPGFRVIDELKESIEEKEIKRKGFSI